MSLLRSVSPPPFPPQRSSNRVSCAVDISFFFFARITQLIQARRRRAAKELVRNGPLNPPTFFRVPFFRTPRVSKTHLSFNSVAPNQAAIERERERGENLQRQRRRNVKKQTAREGGGCDIRGYQRKKCQENGIAAKLYVLKKELLVNKVLKLAHHIP